MSSINPTTTNTLLNYSLSTLPDPLQASPAEGNTQYAAMTFVVSNGGTVAVNVTQLLFTFPTGTLAQQLTSDAGAMLYAASPSGMWNIRMTTDGVFTALPVSGQPVSVTTDGIVFQFFNIPVNQQVGTVAVTVSETASSSGSGSQARTASFDVAKFPYGFFFGNLTPQVPMVQDGHTATLTWQGSDQATYTMYWGTESQDVTEVRSWTSPALTADTSFLLRASVVSQGETVTRDLTTTVVVANPELHATSLQVTGISNLQGNTTIGTNGSSQLTVNSNTTVNGSTLHMGGVTISSSMTANNVSVNGSLTSAAGATFNNATVNGTFTSGANASFNNATLSNATVNGTLTSNNNTNLKNLGVSGTVSMFKNMSRLNLGTYTAQTDGILFAYVNSNGIGAGEKCTGWARGDTAYGTFWCSGGNFTNPSGTANGNNGISLPISKGQGFTVSMQYGSSNKYNPYYSFCFFPMGNMNASQVEAVTFVSDEVPEPEMPEMAYRPTAMEAAEAILAAIASGKKEDLAKVLREQLSLL